MLSTCAVCRLWAEQDEGPYHRDAQPERRDVVEDREGVALQLGIRLARRRRHATARRDRGDLAVRRPRPLLGLPAARLVGRRHAPTRRRVASTCRTRPSCAAASRPTPPAWSSSARSIPAGIRAAPCTSTSWSTPTDAVLTSQLYFPDDVSDQVLASAPYAERPGRDTTNATDEIFPTGGDPAVLDIVLARDGRPAAICLVLPGRKGA